MIKISLATLAVVGLMVGSTSSEMEQHNIKMGKDYYSSAKFRCFKCHGPTGTEGGMGPSFKGIGKRYDKSGLMERAAHACPPTGACDPEQLGAIVDYLRTL